MNLKDTIFNVSAIYKRMPDDTVRSSFYLFSEGLLNKVSQSQLKSFGQIIDNDYKAVKQIIKEAKTKAPKELKTKK